MPKLNKSQAEIFQIIQSELEPLSVDELTARVDYKKKTVNNCLSILQKQKLIFGFHRWGITYYLEGNPDYQ